jgi:hypothetical protein
MPLKAKVWQVPTNGILNNGMSWRAILSGLISGLERFVPLLHSMLDSLEAVLGDS